MSGMMSNVIFELNHLYEPWEEKRLSCIEVNDLGVQQIKASFQRNRHVGRYFYFV